MDRQELIGKLKDLHTELQKVQSLDEAERKTLESLARDIQDVLEKEHDEPDTYAGLGEP